MKQTADLEQDTRYLWSMLRNLSAAVDKGDPEKTSEYKEALELVSGQSEFPAIRAATSRGLHFILVVRPAQRIPVVVPLVAAAGAD